MFPAAVYRVERTVKANGKLQAERYAKYYSIPYNFYIESHDIRIPLIPGRHSVTLKVSSFDWEVRELRKVSRPRVSENLEVQAHPLAVSSHLRDAVAAMFDTPRVRAGLSKPFLRPMMYPWSVKPVAEIYIPSDPDLPGQVRNVKTRTVTIDYSFEKHDGGFSFKAENRPSDETNFAGVFFVVEEEPKGASPLRTVVDISMTGLEYHLPQEYFDYIQACMAQMRATIAQVEYHFRYRAKPIPPWEPHIYPSVGDWVRHVTALHPHTLTGELLEQVQRIMTPAGASTAA
jgi:hypothetical protein